LHCFVSFVVRLGLLLLALLLLLLLRSCPG
jgi:hypothetical protein